MDSTYSNQAILYSSSLKNTLNWDDITWCVYIYLRVSMQLQIAESRWIASWFPLHQWDLNNIAVCVTKYEPSISYVLCCFVTTVSAPTSIFVCAAQWNMLSESVVNLPLQPFRNDYCSLQFIVTTCVSLPLSVLFFSVCSVPSLALTRVHFFIGVH